MAAPAPPCAASLNARDSVRAGGATAADARPMATSNGAKRRRDGAASRSRVRCDRRREDRGDGGASAGLRRRHDRPALGTCGGGGRLERDDRGGKAVHARTSCSRLERARMRAAGERGRPGRALGPSRVAQHAQSADPARRAQCDPHWDQEKEGWAKAHAPPLRLARREHPLPAISYRSPSISKRPLGRQVCWTTPVEAMCEQSAGAAHGRAVRGRACAHDWPRRCSRRRVRRFGHRARIGPGAGRGAQGVSGEGRESRLASQKPAGFGELAESGTLR